MAETLQLSKAELVARALAQMNDELTEQQWTERQKLALTCRILFDGGHDSGLAGQITARALEPETFFTQPFGHGFDEITSSNLLQVNQDLKTLDGKGMPNPANRFHTWIYRARTDVNCIIHTHPRFVSSLSTLEVPLIVSHMDMCPLYDDCAFLERWPGVPVGNEEGEIISGALGDKRAILLSHHGMLVTGKTVEEACVLALLMERAAQMQLTAMAAGEMKPISPELGREAHDWISTPKRDAVTFGYFARRALTTHADCLQ
ncbi:Ribulose-5-phosphate 4-epimerase [Paraburkholderia caribensis MBA4]|uniref:Ribulose-5-phosphate 4-epimerase n=1 Tax=Paraburkholderia caribensis MBA4 TaxID=1323664 RepID=A0A0P0RI41_9BURK|nr:aldolase [Paraburkholderia caribensis]ALL68319.1 Ribulose-5-phosphate 4-epimerase [Paraburkholderia caribensis MBA4]